MNRENVFDYLLVLEKNIADRDCKELAQDYWNSTVEMNSENRHTGKDYRCCVVCVGYTREQRKMLSDCTGIPLSRIISVDDISDDEAAHTNFGMRIAADWVRNGDFLGRIKIYASQEKVSLDSLDPVVEVVYTE